MKKIKYLILGVIIASFLIVGCGNNAGDNGGTEKETISEEDKILEEKVRFDVMNNIYIDREDEILDVKVLAKYKEEMEDKVIVSVTSKNENVEYTEQYILYYENLETEWKYSKTEEYKEEQWTKKPLKAPLVDEIMEEFKEEYKDSRYGFEINISETEPIVDLENNVATFFYEVVWDTIVRYTSEGWACSYEFNEITEEWEASNIEYDVHKMDFDFNHEWQGDDTYRNYSLKNGVVENGILTIDFYIDGEYHKMRGEIETGPRGVDSHVALVDIDNPSYYLEGSFNMYSGSFQSGYLHPEYDKDKQYDIGYKKIQISMSIV